MDVPRPCRFLLVAVLAGLSLSWLGAAPAPPPKAPFRILSDESLARLPWATDVRWADEASVYLALGKDGVVKVSTDPAKRNIQEVFPSQRLGGPFLPSRLGKSREYIAAAGPAFEVTWKKLSEPTRFSEAFDVIEDMDLFDDRLVLLAARRDDKKGYAPEGALVWTGSLGKKLSDLRPVLYDAAGPGAPHLNACGSLEMGAVRFLADGSLLVAPGVQPGIHLYDPNTRLVRTWDTEFLGIDTDCGSLNESQINRLGAIPEERFAWLNLRTTIEDILPLPQGPAIIVRTVSNGTTLWKMKLLRKDGTAETYAIPISSQGILDHLRGDVQGDRIVFLVFEHGHHLGRIEPSRLVLAQLQK